LRNLARISVLKRAEHDQRNGGRQRSAYIFYLRQCRVCHAQPYPKEWSHGKKQACFMNAFELAFGNDLVYTEGVVVHPDAPDFLIEHAWCVDKRLQVYDSTFWKNSDDYHYFGIPMQLQFVENTIVHLGRYGPVMPIIWSSRSPSKNFRHPTFARKSD